MPALKAPSFSGSGTARARAAAHSAAASGRDIVDLTAGEILADLPPSIRSGAIAAVHRNVNRYTDTIGLIELRQALAQRISAATGHTWSAEEVALTAGAKQALFNIAMVTLSPGDEVLIPAPYWTTFPAQALIAGALPVFIDTRTTGYVPGVDDIERALTARTRAIIINSPANPSGAVYDRATLAAIADLACKRDLWIVFDECYGSFVYEPAAHEHILRVAPEARDRTLIVSSFSKHLAMTGWRIGYLAGPREVIKAAQALQSHTTSNPNVIAQHAVLAHLEHDDGRYEQQLYSQLLAARTAGLSILSSLRHVPLPAAQGGFYFYLDLSSWLASGRGRAAAQTADDVVDMLITRAGVATVSGTAFGDPSGLRLSYGVPFERLRGALERLVEVLNAAN